MFVGSSWIIVEVVQVDLSWLTFLLLLLVTRRFDFGLSILRIGYDIGYYVIDSWFCGSGDSTLVGWQFLNLLFNFYRFELCQNGFELGPYIFVFDKVDSLLE